MIELLREAAQKAPDHVAVITPEAATTFAELTERAERAAAALTAKGIRRLAVRESDPVRVFALHGAASLAGAELCVYPLAADAATVATYRERLEHDVLVTREDGHGEGVVDPDELLGWAERATGDLPLDERPVMVMTTGTSGHPQAARHDWGRLLRVAGRINPTPDHRWLLAYGLNQFGGLQILIHVATAQATLVAAETFQPRDALAAMREHGVTHASGTPTFWRFVLTEVRRDGGPVPPLRQVSLGGEAVPSALLDQLRSTFPDARISQIYGATEMGQNITVRDGRAGLPLSVLDEGGDVVFKIVDGELHVRSRSSMLGYHGQEPLAEGQWRATGDLVEVVDDRIMFRGRRSEVINVGGVKVHPLPIEEVVSKVEGVAIAHAFGRPNAMVGNIVALEVVPVPGTDEEELQAAIRAACAHLPRASQPRSITIVPTMETSGNKVNRGTRK
ncbi:class I adenylate-forming enzyme family protein [Nocardioides sp. SYSU D00038]|uniref:class I adenylate-forming enzyme family protein n=1 Tax=Nocardioides sp. SYSU D00038 TaxID=2812554 RepID=UPI0019680B07|nr:fatty acid--CoA ligase family protein [Nocardioides sp. SYSU D00038]